MWKQNRGNVKKIIFTKTGQKKFNDAVRRMTNETNEETEDTTHNMCRVKNVNRKQYIGKRNNRTSIITDINDFQGENEIQTSEYCICKMPWETIDSGNMLRCDDCFQWYHLSCLQLPSIPFVGRNILFYCGQNGCNDDELQLICGGKLIAPMNAVGTQSKEGLYKFIISQEE